MPLVSCMEASEALGQRLPLLTGYGEAVLQVPGKSCSRGLCPPGMASREKGNTPHVTVRIPVATPVVYP